MITPLDTPVIGETFTPGVVMASMARKINALIDTVNEQHDEIRDLQCVLTQAQAEIENLRNLNEEPYTYSVWRCVMCGVQGKANKGKPCDVWGGEHLMEHTERTL